MKIKNLLKSVLVITGLVMMQSCIISTKPNIGYFNDSDGLKSKANFTSINLPLFLAKPMIRKALREENDKDSKAVMNLIRKISKVKILTIENGKEELVKNYSKYLLDNKYEDWMSIKSNGQNVNIKAQQNGEIIKKLMLTVNSGKELVFIDIRGKFSPEDITQVINSTTD